MSHPLSSDEIDRLARKRAGSKLGWYIHATVYVTVNILVYAISEHAFGRRSWSVVPLLGWGLGLALHWISVFVLGASGGLRDRMVQRERERLQRERGGP